MDARIRQIVMEVLGDPLSYPPAMTTWLTTFVGLNATMSVGTPVAQSEPVSPPKSK
jgi:hypothetical protein